MKLCEWEDLPPSMQTPAVKTYYDILRKKRAALWWKRAFDLTASLMLLVLLSPAFLALAIAIKLDSPGPVFYRQVRVTQYGAQFRIHKFRTMVQDADKGSLITVNNDARITRVGKLLRGCRLDEIPQLLDVIAGTVTLVGVRPEAPKFVEAYTNEMMATLLLPAGVTSLASIYYKDEAKLLDAAEDTDKVYTEIVLPGKMAYNLRAMKRFGFWNDIKVLFMTVFAVLGKTYVDETSKSEDVIA